MTTRATQTAEQAFAVAGHGFIDIALLEPFLIIGGLHHMNVAAHNRVVGAAILRTENVKTSGSRRLKPQLCITSGNHVHFDAKSRHRKIVNYVFGNHRQFDSAPQRNMKFVHFPSAVRLLQLPHPLLAHDIHFHRVIGHARNAEIHARRPHEKPDGDNQRNDRPGQLKRDAFVAWQHAIDAIALAIFNREPRDGDRHTQRENQTHESDN